MMGVRKTWDVRNDSGITMRTKKEKREINIERGQERERDRATSGEVIRFCLFENILDCLSIKRYPKNQFLGSKNMLFLGSF